MGTPHTLDPHTSNDGHPLQQGSTAAGMTPAAQPAPDWEDNDPRWEQLDVREQLDHERTMRRLEQRDQGLIIGGWICAFVIPLVGFVIGVALAARGRRVGHAIAIMVIAVVAAVFWSALWSELAASSGDPSTVTYYS